MIQSLNFTDFNQHRINIKEGKIIFQKLIVPAGFNASQFKLHCNVKSKEDFFKFIAPILDPYKSNIEEADLNWNVQMTEDKQLYLQIVPPDDLADTPISVTVICDVVQIVQ